MTAQVNEVSTRKGELQSGPTVKCCMFCGHGSVAIGRCNRMLSCLTHEQVDGVIYEKQTEDAQRILAMQRAWK